MFYLKTSLNFMVQTLEFQTFQEALAVAEAAEQRNAQGKEEAACIWIEDKSKLV